MGALIERTRDRESNEIGAEERGEGKKEGRKEGMGDEGSQSEVLPENWGCLEK